MTFQHVDHIDESELEELTRLEYLALKEPRTVAIPFFFGVRKDTNADYEEAIQTRVKIHKAQLADPLSHWSKVVHKSSGRIAGAVSWVVVEDPQAHKSRFEPQWHPIGPDRDAATLACNLTTEYYSKWYREPHIYIKELFVHPAYRQQGIGKSLMSEILKTADANSWQISLNSTPMALPMYEKYGFILFKPIPLSFDGLEESERLKELRKAYLPFSTLPMLRPVRGIYRKGIDKLPWEE